MQSFLLRASGGLIGGTLYENLWLLVEDGLLTARGEGIPPKVREGLPTIETAFVCEPFVDSHVHLFLTGSFDKAEHSRVASLPRDEALERILGLLRLYRASGIAVVRDGGDPHGLALEAARAANKRPDLYASVLPSGKALYRSGFYGSFLGTGVSDTSEAVKLMEENLRGGAAQVKLLATGINSLERVGEVTEGRFTPPEVDALLRAASSLGLPVMAHANGPLGLTFNHLPQYIEHGFNLAGGDTDLMVGEGVYWTPTTFAWSALVDHPALVNDDGDTSGAEVVSVTHLAHLNDLSTFDRGGGLVLCGSDAGTPGVGHVGGFFTEAGQLASAGIDLHRLATTSLHLLHQVTSPVGEGSGIDLLLYDDPSAFHIAPPQNLFIGGSWLR